MNSFSFELKREVALIEPNGQDEAMSELSAIIRSAGEIERSGKVSKIIVKTEIEDVLNRVQKILLQLYGKTCSVEKMNDLSFSKSSRFALNFPSELTEQILLDTEIMFYDEDRFMQFNQGISKYLVEDEPLAISFVRGIFIGTFSCNVALQDENFVQKKFNGYHAEFVFSKELLARDFSLLLADFDIISKIIERKNSFVVYIKDFDMISDLLALVGASKGVLKLQNENVMRSVKNNVNRQNNCTTANLTKMVDASVRETEAINFVADTIGLDKLDDGLQKVAYLRLANPDESLDALVKLSLDKVSKSALYRRLKKIEKIANELKK